MNRFIILRAAKKRRGLIVKDFWYYDLEQMVHEGLLDKTLPRRSRGRVPGWPLYKISHRGRKALAKEFKERQR